MHVLLRCGQGEYRNNRNYEYAEKWEEYANGTLQKKTVLDDGFGKRSLKHYGWKLNLGILEEIELVRNADGLFMYYVDKSKDADAQIVESLD